jgi:hypothetical protein
MDVFEDFSRGKMGARREMFRDLGMKRGFMVSDRLAGLYGELGEAQAQSASGRRGTQSGFGPSRPDQQSARPRRRAVSQTDSLTSTRIVVPRSVLDWLGLASPDISPNKCIEAANQRKLLCPNGFPSIRGAPRCRQTVTQNNSFLE